MIQYEPITLICAAIYLVVVFFAWFIKTAEVQLQKERESHESYSHTPRPPAPQGSRRVIMQSCEYPNAVVLAPLQELY